MGGKGITGYVALSIGYSKLFRVEENSNRAHSSDPKGSANRTLVPTQDTERVEFSSTDIWQLRSRISSVLDMLIN